ncbi:hypothetical protein [Diaphorobacter sp.]|uniref:hypothetical protein n=1 Tax=Diaphorobacter sp. TaxID=1934310 RepID=UPI0028ABC392|nr:hypothetical protein [Diaphorobacter sp.]
MSIAEGRKVHRVVCHATNGCGKSREKLGATGGNAAFFLFSTSYNNELLKKWAIRRAEAWKCAAWRTGLPDTETPPPQPRR